MLIEPVEMFSHLSGSGEENREGDSGGGRGNAHNSFSDQNRSFLIKTCRL